MINKEIYVYFSNRDFFGEFREHPDFVPPYQYSIYERTLSLRDEFGKLRLKNGMNLRLIYDTGRETACPWCGFPEPEIIKHESRSGFFERFFAQCPKCYARGPLLSVNQQALTNEDVFNEFKEMVKQRWAVRLPKSVTRSSSSVTDCK
mgnify:CR=1 FL=1